MKIETKYIADDGTIFDGAVECLDYEAKQKYQGMFGIIFEDKEGNEFALPMEETFDDSTYNKATKMIVHDNKELEALKFLISYCGWLEFEQITEPGTWVRFEPESVGKYSWQSGVWMKVVDVDHSIIFLDIDSSDMDKDELRARHIATAKQLFETGFNKSEIAKIMGKARSTVYKWIKKQEKRG